jgi:hypothetical protein
MSNQTSFGLYKSLVPAPLFYDFIILFSSWLYTVLIILIFLRTQSAVNPFLKQFFIPTYTSLLHSIDPSVGCGISHNNTIHIIQVQFILLYKCHMIQTKGSHKVVISYK